MWVSVISSLHPHLCEEVNNSSESCIDDQTSGGLDDMGHIWTFAPSPIQETLFLENYVSWQ